MSVTAYGTCMGESCVMFYTNIIMCSSCRQGKEVLNDVFAGLPLYTWILTKWVKPQETTGFTDFFGTLYQLNFLLNTSIYPRRSSLYFGH